MKHNIYFWCADIRGGQNRVSGTTTSFLTSEEEAQGLLEHIRDNVAESFDEDKKDIVITALNKL